MKINHVFLISPPFYSHFKPLLSLGKSFKKRGKEVTIGCSTDFKDEIERAGLHFYEINISKNKNVQKAEMTEQPDSEKERLDEFFASTREGAVETLITQSKHRQKDMLHEPEELLTKIAKIDELFEIDLYFVDILSYGVTLGLYALNLPFVTVCPPHPNTIPTKEDDYGVPRHWPSAITVESDKLEELRDISRETQTTFTATFNQLINEQGKQHKKIENAFSLVSPYAVLYNYFDFNEIEKEDKQPAHIFMGHSFEEEGLSEAWLKRLKGFDERILITLGTFLSNRVDVLEKIIKSCKIYNPKALLVVSAGSNIEKLQEYQSVSVIIEEFIPQKGLLPYMDQVIFHGGCNTFTEAIFYGKPMVILPFSSDQFNIAYDAERKELAEILDPNTFRERDLVEALVTLKNSKNVEVRYWSKVSKQRGPDFAVESLLEQLDKL